MAESRRVPAGFLGLIRLASWLVPRPGRAAWRSKWEGGIRNWWAFLVERDELTPSTRAQLALHCWSALRDAFWSRFTRDELRRTRRSAPLLLAACALFLAVLTLASGGFSATRALWAPLPYKDPGQLYVFSQTFLGQPYGVPPRNIRVWREKCKLTRDLAAYFRRGPQAQVTSNFFSLLGAGSQLGRTFQETDERSTQPLALLSYGLWRGGFGADPGVAGRDITWNGRPWHVIGVLPRDFWALSPGIELWTLLDLRSWPRSRSVGAIGRVKPGVSWSQARAELIKIVKQERLWLSGPGIVLLPVREWLRAPFFAYATAFSWALAAAIALFQIGRLWLARRAFPAEWRAWSFFVLKTVLLLACFAGVWIEATSAVRLREEGFLKDLVTGLLFSWLYLLGCGGIFIWSLRDQRRRCPVCLSRLTLPVTIGSWSSVLEPASTEFLCEQGHGALCVPETQSSASEPDHWTALDESWRELFR